MSAFERMIFGVSLTGNYANVANCPVCKRDHKDLMVFTYPFGEEVVIDGEKYEYFASCPTDDKEIKIPLTKKEES